MNTEPLFRDQQDLVRWIDNKLGSNELWGGRQASFVLNHNILVELETCFQELEPHIKLKIIQAMVHLSQKTLQAWKKPLSNLIEIARQDPDDWVETVADIYRGFPDNGLIQCSSKEDSFFNRTHAELQKIVEDNTDGKNFFFEVPPPDSEFMSKSILNNGILPATAISNEKRQHFSIRATKVTRSQKLLEDVKRAAEQQSNPSSKKNHGLISSFPIKIRSTAKKLDNSLPMKGIPTANTFKMSSGFTNESKKYQQRTLLKRAGGAMLIDIAELPNPNGRRRRNVETITVQPQVDKKMCTNGTVVAPNANRKNSKTSSSVKKKDSDTANSINIDDKLQVDEDRKDKEKPNCEGMQKATSTKIKDMPNLDKGEHQQPTMLAPSTSTLQTTFSDPATTSSYTSSAFNTVLSASSLPESRQYHQPIPQPMNFGNFQQPQQQQQHFNNTINYMGTAGPGMTSHVQQPESISASSTSGNYLNNNSSNPNNFLVLQQFDGLLKDANKLTPMTYNLIISFLSGNKNNILQDKLGSIITLPFSESIEFEPTTNGVGMTASLVEVFFQMDYRSGEWKRLKKSRTLRPDEMGQYSHLFTVKNDQGSNQVAGSSYATDQVEQWNWGGNLTGQTNNL